MAERTTDSRIDTYEHILKVQKFLLWAIVDLQERLMEHDVSKLVSPELQGYDTVVPKLANLTYGTDEYRAALREMKPAIQHHYEHNRHHPEHFPNGVNDMTLLDVVEMVCDWVAASQRMKKSVDADRYDGNVERSLAHNKERFGLSDQLISIIRNTYREMGVLE